MEEWNPNREETEIYEIPDENVLIQSPREILSNSNYILFIK